MGLSYKNIFKRYEIKYRLYPNQYSELTDFLQEYTKPDIYYKYTIGNVYYDTWDFRLIQNSLSKPIYKEKLRMRSYGIPAEGQDVFLEVKKKFQGTVYKRRTELPEREAVRFIETGETSRQGQIEHELEWFIHFYKPEPKVYIAYDRQAFVGKEDEELRITFDSNIRWRQEKLCLAEGTWGTPINMEGYLMEIKAPGALPIWLVKKLNEMRLFPASFSKYGTVYSNYIFKNMKKEDLKYA